MNIEKLAHGIITNTYALTRVVNVFDFVMHRILDQGYENQQT